MHPPPSASLRRPSVVAHVRSTSFSAAHSTEISPPLKRSRGLSTSTPNTRAPRKQPRIPSTPPHARSCWGGHPRRGARHGWRLSSSVHKPDCKWMRSSQHPQATPRDKDCPACQEAEKRPEELSPSELWWERRMQRFRDAVDNDAYDTIFGWSNDMLRGRPLRPRWFWEDEIKPWSLKGMQEDPVKGSKEWMLHDKTILDKVQDHSAEKGKAAAPTERPRQPSTTNNKATPEASERPTKKVKVEAEPAKKIPVKQPQQHSKASSPHIEAYSSWSYKSVDSTGKSLERSGASTYDPISGRMVPIAQTPVAPREPAAAATSEAPEATQSTSASEGYVTSNTPIKTASDEYRRNATQEPNFILGGHRSAQYEQAHISLARAQMSVESLRETYLTLPKPMSPALQEPSSLALTHARLQSTQLALKAYKATALNDGKAPRGSREMAEQDRRSAKSTTIKGADTDGLSEESGIKRKTTLESSWRSEQQRKTPPPPAPGHFRQRDNEISADGAAGVAKLAYSALHRRKAVPLKHMTAHELGLHRQYLVEAWAKQQRERSESRTKSKTAADKRLDQEVEALKTQHAAWESRWNLARSSATSSTAEETKLAPTSVETTGGEGDMCPNVAKFCNPARMYKRKAPHALIAEDPELAQNIKNIYEEAYGNIDENHRHGKRMMTQQALDQQEVRGIRQESQAVEGQRATKRVKTEAPQLNSKVQQNFAASQTQAEDDDSLTRSATDGAEADTINAYEVGKARKGLPTVLDRRLDSSRAREASTPEEHATSMTKKRETSVATTTRTTAPEAALFRLVRYDEATGQIEESSASTHPDKWSMPRLSANTAFEMLRDKKGYQRHLVPLMQQLRRNGYVLYDLARDDKTIVFVRQPTSVPTTLPTKIIALSTASSGSYSSIVNAKAKMEASEQATLRSAVSPKREREAASNTAVMSAISRRQTTNPVDPSLRPQFPQTQTGNFASPTGYVNLEAPEATASQQPKPEPASSEKPSPDGLDAKALKGMSLGEKLTRDDKSCLKSTSPGQTGQRVSREEPVFSGAKGRTNRSKSSRSPDDTPSSDKSHIYIALTVGLVVAVMAELFGIPFAKEMKRRAQEAEQRTEARIPFWDDDSGKDVEGLGGTLEPIDALFWEAAAHRPVAPLPRYSPDESVAHERSRAASEQELETPKCLRERKAEERRKEIERKESFARASREPRPTSRAARRLSDEQSRRQRVLEASADVTMMSLSLGFLAWVFLTMLERRGD